MTESTLLLIDDHPLFLSGISLVLREGLGKVKVLEAGSLTEALQLRDADPALILLDQHLQGVSGVTGIAALLRKWPGTKVALLSGFDLSPLRDDAIAAGAVAFISKTDKPHTLLHQVRTLLDNRGPDAPAGPAPSASESLTPRQVEVLELLCRGLSNKAIAQRLHLSEYTVRGHVQTLLGLLGASSRGEAAFNARDRGWIV
ncbi:MAG: DNA-binding response regulator [Alcanivorax sp.]|nr:DNA-binding response regulator [Alcanivorax sp.]MAY09384.1 DNA-binding response regulator [Alcanivorax sp.]MBI56171.1 DNA-binding response regulator [Alcanivorax sp.]MBU58325.1 DNA-binding response regulator [Alcanivorax sp.]